MRRVGSGGVLALLLVLALGACEAPQREWVLPDPAEAAAWFGDQAEARLSGNLLEIRGTMDEDFLRRGGRIWARSGPYFYLFNVHVQRLFQEYPDLAAVRAIALTPRGEELSRATLHRDALNEFTWRDALARASIAQQQGTESPRRIEELIRFGEDRTEFEYRR
jgi:hypothetical protein